MSESSRSSNTTGASPDGVTSGPARSRLDEISTQWSVLGDPQRFVLRYGPAITKYLRSLVHDDHDVEDVCQDFLANYLTRGFPNASPQLGRFRKYLKAAVRNAALDFFRRRQSDQRTMQRLAAEVGEEEAATPEDETWRQAWRSCVLELAWARLREHSRRSSETPYDVVLQVAKDFPDESSQQQADRVALAIGRPLRADAYRKQLSRARKLYAQQVIDEVSQTIAPRDADEIERELADLGLLEYTRELL